MNKGNISCLREDLKEGPFKTHDFSRERGWKGSKLRFFFFLREQNSRLIIHTLCMCGLWQIPQDQGRTPLKPKTLQHAVLDNFLCNSLMGNFGMDQTVSTRSEQKNCIPSGQSPHCQRDPEYKFYWVQTFTHKLQKVDFYLCSTLVRRQRVVGHPKSWGWWSTRNPKQN